MPKLYLGEVKDSKHQRGISKYCMTRPVQKQSRRGSGKKYIHEFGKNESCKENAKGA